MTSANYLVTEELDSLTYLIKMVIRVLVKNKGVTQVNRNNLVVLGELTVYTTRTEGFDEQGLDPRGAFLTH